MLPGAVHVVILTVLFNDFKVSRRCLQVCIGFKDI